MSLLHSQTTGSSGRGRPRQYGKRVYFGLQVTPEERRMIKQLSIESGKPESRTLLDLVKREYERRIHRRYTPAELRAMNEKERNAIMQMQATSAASYYQNPDAILDTDDELTDY